MSTGVPLQPHASARRTPRPGRGPLPGLVRVRLPSGRDGWRATARLPSGAVRKVFFDGAFGGAAAARDAARAWRRIILAQAGVPDTDRRRVVLKPRTTSGRVGVHLRPARRGASAYWTATFTQADGTRLQRVWSVRQYGHEQALALAIAQREAWEVAELGSALPKPGPASAPEKARAFMESFIPPGGTLSDAELLGRWLIEPSGGPIAVRVFVRFRDLVRLELERLGLSALDAAQRAPLAFALAEATRGEIPPETTLRDRLLAAAHAVIHSTGAE